jgi:hypothetical protein
VANATGVRGSDKNRVWHASPPHAHAEKVECLFQVFGQLVDHHRREFS